MHPRSRHFFVIGQLILPAILGFGATWGTATAPAVACGDTYAKLATAELPPFGFQNGVHLGLNEADTLKILGTPQQRQGSGTRCGSSRQRLSYAGKTLLILDAAIDNPEPPGGKIRYIPPTARKLPLPSPAAKPQGKSPQSERVIVRFATQNPELVFSQGIRVGDRAEKLLNAYGQPQSQSETATSTTLRYQQGKEILWIELQQDRIATIELLLQPPNRPPISHTSLFDRTRPGW
jgi:hypothetical protein